jgi:hypothetical protein
MRYLRSFGLSVAALAVAAACVTTVPSSTGTPRPASTPPAVTLPPLTLPPVTLPPATLPPVVTPAPIVTTPPVVTQAPVITEPPATQEPAPTTAPPTDAPATPSEGLDPSLSDAGVVGRITINGEERDPGRPRNGTHDIIGTAADGSHCAPSDIDDGFTAVAWHYESGENNVRQMFVVVPLDAVPAADGTTTDITDGRAGADFNSETGFGTLYFGDATRENEGHARIDVTRIGELLVFDYEGETWDGISFTGQVICAPVEP